MTTSADPALPKTDMDRYLIMMRDIKLRMWFILQTPAEKDVMPIDNRPKGNAISVGEILTMPMHARPKAVYIHGYHVEFAFLQLRNIVEQIAYSSLISNEEEFSKHFTKDEHKYSWLNTLFRDLEKANPDFYAIPQIEVPGAMAGVRVLQDWTGDYLTKSDMLALYAECGEVLHTRNPYKPPLDHSKHVPSIFKWYSKIVLLLRMHKIRLLGDKHFYLIQMNDDNAAPSYTLFGLAPPEVAAKLDAAKKAGQA